MSSLSNPPQRAMKAPSFRYGFDLMPRLSALFFDFAFPSSPGCNLEDFFFSVGGSTPGLIIGSAVTQLINLGQELTTEANADLSFGK